MDIWDNNVQQITFKNVGNQSDSHTNYISYVCSDEINNRSATMNLLLYKCQCKLVSSLYFVMI